MSEPSVISFSKKKNNRRKLLKEFYKLQESNKRELENLGLQNGIQQEPTTIRTSESNEEELTLNNFEEFVKRKDFKTLISRENKITEELNSNQGEIKSIIYNNYYELIKISNYLENLKNGASETRKDETMDNIEDDTTEFTIGVDDDEEDKQDTTLKILNKIRQNISSIKSQDLSI